MRWAGVLAALGFLAFARPARADLDADMATLSSSFAANAKVRRLPARLVERGSMRPLLIPADLANPLAEDCVTVVVMGTVSTSFVLRFLPAAGVLAWPEGEHPELSSAGAAQLVRCGVRKSMLSRLAVEMRSPRGVIEVLVARAERPLPPLGTVIGHRNPGPMAPLGVSGPRPRAVPLADRLKALEAARRREGAARVSRRAFRPQSDGSGEVEIKLDAGCHRLELVAGPSENVDLDADLLRPDGEIVSTDHTESNDASLETCVGERRAFSLRFVGAGPSEVVSLLDAEWALPAGLPAHWGPDVAGRLATALREHHARGLDRSPVYTSLGVAGITLLPLELEPSRCYVAAAALLQGESNGIALSAEIGERQAQNHAGATGEGTVIAFCARGARRALVNVEARGAGSSWLFALWTAGKLPLGGTHE